MKSRVAVLRVGTEGILERTARLCDLAGMREALAPGATTILKDNISWHFPFPGANTTPWQMEGTIRALRASGLADLACVQNKTVVTDAFKGEDLNHYLPILKAYGVPVLYNFRDQDMKWIEYRPKRKMRVLDRIYPEGIRIPDYFFAKNIVHLPTVKCHMFIAPTLVSARGRTDRRLSRGTRRHHPEAPARHGRRGRVPADDHRSQPQRHR